MARLHVGQTERFTAYVSSQGVVTTAPQITFKYKYPSGKTATLTPTLATDANGKNYYYTDHTFQESGSFHYRWDTDGTLDSVTEGVVNIAPTVF